MRLQSQKRLNNRILNIEHPRRLKSLRGCFYIYVLFPSFLIPNINLKNPDNSFGLLISTTFINTSENHLQQDIPKSILQTAKTAIKNFGGQKQLRISPSAKAIVINPRLGPFFLIVHPPDITLYFAISKRLQLYSGITKATPSIPSICSLSSLKLFLFEIVIKKPKLPSIPLFAGTTSIRTSLSDIV